MRVKDYIQTVPGDMVIYLGAESAFFFIGTRHEFYRDINLINDSYRRIYENRIKYHNNEISKLKKRIQELNAMIRDEDLENELKYCVDKMAMHEDLLAKVTDYLNHFIELQDRTVKSIYKRELCESGSVAIIEGKEIGVYWFKTEYDAAMMKNV